MDDVSSGFKKIIKIGGALLVCLILFMIFKPFTIISSNEYGLKFRLGKVSTDVLKQGLNFKIPIIESIETFTAQPIQVDVRVPVGSDGAITKNNQTVGANMIVYYKYKPEMLPQMYSNLGTAKCQSLVFSNLVETFKSEIGKYDIFQLPNAQEDIRNNVLSRARAKVTEYPFEITDIKITNYDWSDEFDKEIATTMRKAQEVNQKIQELQIAEQEAQKQVKTASAQKDAMVQIAEGKRDAAKLEAEAKELEGNGIRKYNEALRANMDLEVKLRELDIEKVKWSKWNGQQVPVNNYGPIPVQLGGVLPTTGK